MARKSMKGAFNIVCRYCKASLHVRFEECPKCKKLTPTGEKKACRFEALEKLATW